MNLEIVRTANSPYLFRSANPLRDWMDETFSNHAYRCVPLVNANSYQSRNKIKLVCQQGR